MVWRSHTLSETGELASSTCAHCPKSGQSNQIARKPIITFHTDVTYVNLECGRKRAGEMATFSEAAVESACVVVASSLGYPTLREQQLRVLLSYIRGNDVFAVLQGMRRVYATRYYQWCSTDFWARKTPWWLSLHHSRL